jgi:hypothetical protein
MCSLESAEAQVQQKQNLRTRIAPQGSLHVNNSHTNIITPYTYARVRVQDMGPKQDNSTINALNSSSSMAVGAVPHSYSSFSRIILKQITIDGQALAEPG